MSVLGGVAIDVAIGLVFCYASISIISSAIYEAFASLFKLRAASLLDGVKAMLNDKDLSGLAHALYKSALVNPRSDGTENPKKRPKILPSYIEPRAFALALVDVIQHPPAITTNVSEAAAAMPGADAITRALNGVEAASDAAQTIKEGIKTIAVDDEQLGRMLTGMYARAKGEVGRFEVELADWFDNGMDRVAGGYKRQAQLVTFLIAFAIAGLFNVDTFHLFDILWNHPGAAATLAASAARPDDVQTAIAALKTLPVGWSVGWTSFTWFTIFGWLATATSVLFGGPFWFDLLQRFVSLRGAGAKPKSEPPAGDAKPAATAGT